MGIVRAVGGRVATKRSEATFEWQGCCIMGKHLPHYTEIKRVKTGEVAEWSKAAVC